MKRSQINPSSKGMKRTTMARGTSTLARSPMQRQAKPMKAGRRKTTPIRQSAKQEACTIRIPGVCNNDPATVVWCHENSYAAGKGMGLKAKDEHGAYGCCACHAVYDGQAPRPPGLTKEDVDTYFARGKHVSRLILQQKGLLKTENDCEASNAEQ
jgi:hypothetical protein